MQRLSDTEIVPHQAGFLCEQKANPLRFTRRHKSDTQYRRRMTGGTEGKAPTPPPVQKGRLSPSCQKSVLIDVD